MASGPQLPNPIRKNSKAVIKELTWFPNIVIPNNASTGKHIIFAKLNILEQKIIILQKYLEVSKVFILHGVQVGQGPRRYGTRNTGAAGAFTSVNFKQWVQASVLKMVVELLTK